VTALSCPKTPQGKIAVNEYLEVPGCPGVWALGDCAAVSDPRSGGTCPPTAQQAIRQAFAVAGNIAASLRGFPKRPYSYRSIGVLAGLGRRSAVVEIWRFRFSGCFAWWLWRTIYLLKLPGLERKVRVALDWTLDLFFHRDIVLLKAFTNQANNRRTSGASGPTSHAVNNLPGCIPEDSGNGRAAGLPTLPSTGWKDQGADQ